MAGNRNSFIFNDKDIDVCAAKYKEKSAALSKVIDKVKKDAAGIDWTDDNGNTLQEIFAKFTSETEKIPDRITKNSTILDNLSANAAQLQNNIENGMNDIYG